MLSLQFTLLELIFGVHPKVAIFLIYTIISSFKFCPVKYIKYNKTLTAVIGCQTLIYSASFGNNFQKVHAHVTPTTFDIT